LQSVKRTDKVWHPRFIILLDLRFPIKQLGNDGGFDG